MRVIIEDVPADCEVELTIRSTQLDFGEEDHPPEPEEVPEPQTQRSLKAVGKS